MSQRNLILGFRSPGIRIRSPFVDLESQLRDSRNLSHPSSNPQKIVRVHSDMAQPKRNELYHPIIFHQF